MEEENWKRLGTIRLIDRTKECLQKGEKAKAARYEYEVIRRASRGVPGDSETEAAVTYLGNVYGRVIRDLQRALQERGVSAKYRAAEEVLGEFMTRLRSGKIKLRVVDGNSPNTAYLDAVKSFNRYLNRITSSSCKEEIRKQVQRIISNLKNGALTEVERLCFQGNILRFVSSKNPEMTGIYQRVLILKVQHKKNQEIYSLLRKEDQEFIEFKVGKMIKSRKGVSYSPDYRSSVIHDITRQSLARYLMKVRSLNDRELPPHCKLSIQRIFEKLTT